MVWHLHFSANQPLNRKAKLSPFNWKSPLILVRHCIGRKMAKNCSMWTKSSRVSNAKEEIDTSSRSISRLIHVWGKHSVMSLLFPGRTLLRRTVVFTSVLSPMNSGQPSRTSPSKWPVRERRSMRSIVEKYAYSCRPGDKANLDQTDKIAPGFEKPKIVKNTKQKSLQIQCRCKGKQEPKVSWRKGKTDLKDTPNKYKITRTKESDDTYLFILEILVSLLSLSRTTSQCPLRYTECHNHRHRNLQNLSEKRCRWFSSLSQFNGGCRTRTTVWALRIISMIMASDIFFLGKMKKWRKKTKMLVRDLLTHEWDFFSDTMIDWSFRNTEDLGSSYRWCR